MWLCGFCLGGLPCLTLYALPDWGLRKLLLHFGAIERFAASYMCTLFPSINENSLQIYTSDKACACIQAAIQISKDQKLAILIYSLLQLIFHQQICISLCLQLQQVCTGYYNTVLRSVTCKVESSSAFFLFIPAKQISYCPFSVWLMVYARKWKHVKA